MARTLYNKNLPLAAVTLHVTVTFQAGSKRIPSLTGRMVVRALALNDVRYKMYF